MKTVTVTFTSPDGDMDAVPNGSRKESLAALRREGWVKDWSDEGQVVLRRKDMLKSGDNRSLHLLTK